MDETVYRGVRFGTPDVLRAFIEFDRNLRTTFPASRYKKYAISHAGKWYPPKEVLRLATRCEDRDFVLGGGPNINRCFEQLGFAVIENWGMSSATAPTLTAPVVTPATELSAAEGRELLRLHRTRERSQPLVALKKREVLLAEGRLECETCGFDFAAAYGPRGEGFAECHHTLPISQSAPDRRTRTSELALVCANCHRMLHRRPWVSVQELHLLVRSRRGK